MTTQSLTHRSPAHHPLVRLTHPPVIRLILLLTALPAAWLLRDPQTSKTRSDPNDLLGGGDSGKAFSWFENPAVIVGDGAGPFEPDATARTASAGMISMTDKRLDPAVTNTHSAPAPEPAALALLTLLGTVSALRRHRPVPRRPANVFRAGFTQPESCRPPEKWDGPRPRPRRLAGIHPSRRLAPLPNRIAGRIDPPFVLAACLALALTPALHADTIGLAGRITDCAAVSDNGRVVIGRSDTIPSLPSDPATYRWSHNGTFATFEFLRDLDGNFNDSHITNLSGDGQTVVGAHQYWDWNTSTPKTLAYAWSPATGFQTLGDIPDGVGDAIANAASYDGSVVVGMVRTTAGRQPFRWTAAEGMVGLGNLPGGPSYGEATDVSADGSVVVGWSGSAEGHRAFRWTAATGLVNLGALPDAAFQSAATAVSTNGTIVVGTSRDAAGNDRAFRWTAATGMVDLGDLPGGAITRAPVAVSADGNTIAGTARTNTTGNIGFVWTHLRGMRTFPAFLADDYSAGTGTQYVDMLTDMSPDARVFVGNSIEDNNPWIVRGWYTVLPPIGDLNLDNQVTAADLPMFIYCLTAPPESLQSRDPNLADLNRDGRLDGRDIAAMVAAITTP